MPVISFSSLWCLVSQGVDGNCWKFEAFMLIVDEFSQEQLISEMLGANKSSSFLSCDEQDREALLLNLDVCQDFSL